MQSKTAVFHRQDEKASTQTLRPVTQGLPNLKLLKAKDVNEKRKTIMVNTKREPSISNSSMASRSSFVQNDAASNKALQKKQGNLHPDSSRTEGEYLTNTIKNIRESYTPLLSASSSMTGFGLARSMKELPGKQVKLLDYSSARRNSHRSNSGKNESIPVPDFAGDNFLVESLNGHSYQQPFQTNPSKKNQFFMTSLSSAISHFESMESLNGDLGGKILDKNLDYIAKSEYDRVCKENEQLRNEFDPVNMQCTEVKVTNKKLMNEYALLRSSVEDKNLLKVKYEQEIHELKNRLKEMEIRINNANDVITKEKIEKENNVIAFKRILNRLTNNEASKNVDNSFMSIVNNINSNNSFIKPAISPGTQFTDSNDANNEYIIAQINSLRDELSMKDHELKILRKKLGIYEGNERITRVIMEEDNSHSALQQLRQKDTYRMSPAHSPSHAETTKFGAKDKNFFFSPTTASTNPTTNMNPNQNLVFSEDFSPSVSNNNFFSKIRPQSAYSAASLKKSIKFTPNVQPGQRNGSPTVTPNLSQKQLIPESLVKKTTTPTVSNPIFKSKLHN